jgi:hypothetical protein
VKRFLILLLALVAISVPAVSATSAKPAPDSQAALPKLPICHMAGTKHAKTLLLNVKAAVNHLLPSIVDPKAHHLDALGDCSLGFPVLPRPTADLRHLKVPVCHREGTDYQGLTLSVRDTLVRLFIAILAPDPDRSDDLGVCPDALPPPPPPPPPAPGPDGEPVP